MDKLTRKKLLKSVTSKFTSHNDCEVSQATVTLEEFEAISETVELLEDLEIAEAAKAQSEWVSVDKALPSKFEGYRKFRIKVLVGSIEVKECVQIVLGKWRGSGEFNFSVGDWHRVTHWDISYTPPKGPSE